MLVPFFYTCNILLNMLQYEKKLGKRYLKMDNDTKIELLKIFAMVVVLVLLIIGIVWMNKEDKGTANTETPTEVVESNEEETKTEENAENTENSNENNSENNNSTENPATTENNENAGEQQPSEQANQENANPESSE